MVTILILIITVGLIVLLCTNAVGRYEQRLEDLKEYCQHTKDCEKKFRPGYAEPYPSNKYHPPAWIPCTCDLDRLLGVKDGKKG